MNQALKELDRIVTIIASSVSPDKIILFGSFARGDSRDDSDFDILVLKKNIKNEREITRTLYKKFLSENIATPVDLIAIDYDKYNYLKDKTGYIYKTISQEGKVLYG